MKYVKIEGDVEFVMQIVKLVEYLCWELEEDFVKLVGDVVVYWIVMVVCDVGVCVCCIGCNVFDFVVEYWFDENLQVVWCVLFGGFDVELVCVCDVFVWVEKWVE